MAKSIIVHADWDPAASVWVATSSDLQGLVTEAPSVEALRAKLPGIILDLLDVHGIAEVPTSVEVIARSSDRLVAAE